MMISHPLPRSMTSRPSRSGVRTSAAPLPDLAARARRLASTEIAYIGRKPGWPRYVHRSERTNRPRVTPLPEWRSLRAWSGPRC
jgi:hypothetical protein